MSSIIGWREDVEDYERDREANGGFGGEGKRSIIF